jgi:hypothetical protein
MTVLTSLLIGFWDSSCDIISWDTLYTICVIVGAIYLLVKLLKFLNRLSGETLLELFIVALLVFLIYWIPTLFSDSKKIGTTETSVHNKNYDNRTLYNSFPHKGSAPKTTVPKVSEFEKVTFRENQLLRKGVTYKIYLDYVGFAIFSRERKEPLTFTFKAEKGDKTFSTTTRMTPNCICYKITYKGELPAGMYLFTPEEDLECSIKALSSITKCEIQQKPPQ